MSPIELKKKLHNIIDGGDDKFLKHIYAIAKSYEEQSPRAGMKEEPEEDNEAGTYSLEEAKKNLKVSPSVENLSGVLEGDIKYKRKLTIHLPFPLDLEYNEVKMAFASKLYELGEISLGQGAELVGCTKEDFMISLADYGVSIFNYPPEDLDQDIENASNYSI